MLRWYNTEKTGVGNMESLGTAVNFFSVNLKLFENGKLFKIRYLRKLTMRISEF